jgi:hypothetical protein
MLKMNEKYINKEREKKTSVSVMEDIQKPINPTTAEHSPAETPSSTENTSSVHHLPESADISRKTIVVLLVLVTILSTVGTFAVLNELWTMKGTTTTTSDSAVKQAQVQFTILSPPEKPAETQATARVTVGILDAKKGQ